MTIWQAIVLGVVQGVTEFLPISSSGHLILVPWIFGWPIYHDEALNKTFDVALHFGTFIGVALYFRADIARLVRGWLRSIAQRSLAGDPYRQLSWLILISTIPGAAAGMRFESIIEHKLGAPLLIASLLVAVGLVMALAEVVSKRRRALKDVGWWDAIVIGVGQAFALAPGTSRSGITMSIGLFGNLTRETAARYSFLISIPIIGGAAAVKGLHLVRHGLPPGMAWPFVVGVLSAAVSGYIAIKYLLAYLQRGTLYPFVAYRIVVGALFIYLALRVAG